MAKAQGDIRYLQGVFDSTSQEFLGISDPNTSGDGVDFSVPVYSDAQIEAGATGVVAVTDDYDLVDSNGNVTNQTKNISIITPSTLELSTSAKELHVYTIPAKNCTVGTEIVIDVLFTQNNSANNKTAAIWLNDGGGGFNGAALFFNAATSGSNITRRISAGIKIIGENTQMSGILNSTSGFGSSANAPVITNRASSITGLDIIIAGQLASASAGEYITAEYSTVTIKNGVL